MKMRVQLILEDGTIIQGEEMHCEYRIHDAYLHEGSQEYDPYGFLNQQGIKREPPLISVTATVVIRDRVAAKAVMDDSDKYRDMHSRKEEDKHE